MKLAIWKTNHQIADTVADALHAGLPQSHIMTTAHSYLTSMAVGVNDWFGASTNIAYGILRGTGEVFKECTRRGLPWLHLDRGYFHPNHFDGYYRVSLNGTQETKHFKPDYERLVALKLDIKSWRGCDHSKPVLVCPPTDAVKSFFNIIGWNEYSIIAYLVLNSGKHANFNKSMVEEPKYVIRHKGDPTPINFNDYNYVLTFNSSVGWQALLHGIPCISDPTHSIVGAFMHNISLDEQCDKRLELFACMSAAQFKLGEEGLWKYISVLMQESQSLRMSQLTQ